jgi:hypothetical protein
MSVLPLKLVRSRLSGRALELVVESPQGLTADAAPEVTIIDMLGRQMTDIRAALDPRTGTLTISAVAPGTAPDADPSSYLVTVSGHSTWFAPSSPRAVPDGTEASKLPAGGASIDYLGRDYISFTTMMRSRVSQIVGDDSAWALDHPADPMTTILEVLAYAGDHLSFRQDAAGTESYLTTARRRLSLRRHARLRDYAVDDGCNARTALVFKVNAAGLLQAGLQVVTLQPGQPDLILPVAPALVASTAVFETMHEQPVSPLLNDLGALLVQSAAYTIPADAIGLALGGGATGLVPGQLIMIQQLNAPAGVAVPFGAQALRLLTVEEVTDRNGAVTTALGWHPEDALIRPLTVPPANAVGTVSLYGNVVLADHGLTVPATLHPDTVPAAGGFRPEVVVEDVVSAAPPPQIDAAFDGTQDLVVASLMVASAKASLTPDPRLAVPCITLSGTRPAMAGRPATTGQPAIIGVTDVWNAQQDLLSTASTGRSFAVALEDGYGGDERHLVLRFGDGGLGYPPAPGTVFTATARTGNGQTGRVRANSLLQVIGPAPLVTWVTNPLSASPFAAEDSESIRLFATTNFRTNLRGIEPSDWERLGNADPLVTEVRATLGPDGHAPCTVGLTTRKTIPDGIAFPVASARLMQYGVLGALPEIVEGTDVALDVALIVYCATGTNIGAARERLFRRIGTGSLPDGFPAFFNPGRWPLGRQVRLDELVDAIKADPSVSFVVFDPRLDPRIVFKTVEGDDHTASNVAQGHIEIGAHQRARVGNDAFHPALGSARLYVVATP